MIWKLGGVWLLPQRNALRPGEEVEPQVSAHHCGQLCALDLIFSAYLGIICSLGGGTVVVRTDASQTLQVLLPKKAS